MRSRCDYFVSVVDNLTLKDFHDQFLSYGGPPIPLVRAQVLQEAGGELF